MFRGRDRELARAVAIKVTAWHSADVERLRDEARVLAALEHPGIVPLHDAGRLPDGRAYYVMAIVHGERFDAWVERAALARLFDRVCDTVAFAHARGILHLDLKPANIMVGPFGDVRALDWGLARLGSSGGRRTEDGRTRMRARKTSVVPLLADHAARRYSRHDRRLRDVHVRHPGAAPDADRAILRSRARGAAGTSSRASARSEARVVRPTAWRSDVSPGHAI